MRKFIIRTLVLALLFVLVLGGFNYYIGLKLRDNIHYANLNRVQYCVVGHSHPECAFNDSLIVGMKNYALSGEAYFYNYHKIKSMLLKGVHLDNVFIEYANNSLSAELCEWIWDKQNLSRSYVKFSPFVSVSDNAFLFTHNPRGWLNAFGLSMKWRLDQSFSSGINYLDYSGGYKWLARNSLDSLIRASGAFNQPIVGDSAMVVCEMNQFYLRQMIQLLRDNHAQVYLIRSPVHKMYPGYRFESAYDSIYNHLFSDVDRLDFAKFPLHDDDYADFEHLNHKGATKFSIAFNEMLSNGLLSSSNKQQFIDQYFSKIR